MVTLPGLIDCHVHFRVPGQEYKEDWSTGSAAALRGGVTAVIDMPSNVPPILTGAAVQKKIDQIKPMAQVQFRLPIGVTDQTITEALLGQTLACGFKVFLQPHATGMVVLHDDTLHQLYQGAQKVIMIHDDTGVERIMPFVRRYRKTTYFCHISTAEELAKLKQAKADGLPVLAEVTLHHLWFDRTNQSLGRRAKVNPPLRTPPDREALWQGIRDGTIDTIATDHAPHTVAEKDSADGAAGFPGIEFFAPLLLTAVAEHKITIDDIVRCCVTNPKRIFGFTDTGTIVVDLDLVWTVTIKDIKSKCGWSPYLGQRLTGQVVTTHATL